MSGVIPLFERVGRKILIYDASSTMRRNRVNPRDSIMFLAIRREETNPPDG